MRVVDPSLSGIVLGGVKCSSLPDWLRLLKEHLDDDAKKKRLISGIGLLAAQGGEYIFRLLARCSKV